MEGEEEKEGEDEEEDGGEVREECDRTNDGRGGGGI